MATNNTDAKEKRKTDSKYTKLKRILKKNVNKGANVADEVKHSLHASFHAKGTHDKDPNAARIKDIMLSRMDEFTSKRKTRLLIGSWNCNGIISFEESLDDWLKIPNDGNEPEIVVVGFQEVVSLNLKNIALSNSKVKKQAAYWKDRILNHLNSSTDKDVYVHLKHDFLIGLLILVFVKKDLQPSIDYVWAESVPVGGKTDHAGNKGGVSIRFNLFDSTLCFVCSHLEANRDEVKERNEDYCRINKKTEFVIGEDIIKELNDRRSAEELIEGNSPESASTSEINIEDHDMIFWFGDLNYRIDESVPTQEVLQLCESGEFHQLLEKDQLNIEKSADRAFMGFQEGVIEFPPTYKYIKGSDDYDSKRAPAWCDRILYKSRKNNSNPNISQVNYGKSEINVSDHKPILANFILDIELVQKDKRDAVRKEVESFVSENFLEA